MESGLWRMQYIAAQIACRFQGERGNNLVSRTRDALALVKVGRSGSPAFCKGVRSPGKAVKTKLFPEERDDEIDLNA